MIMLLGRNGHELCMIGYKARGECLRVLSKELTNFVFQSKPMCLWIQHCSSFFHVGSTRHLGDSVQAQTDDSLPIVSGNRYVIK